MTSVVEYREEYTEEIFQLIFNIKQNEINIHI
jgi:hypothetical protein